MEGGGVDGCRHGASCGTAWRGCGSGGVYVMYACMYVYVCVCMCVSVYMYVMNDVVEKVVDGMQRVWK